MAKSDDRYDRENKTSEPRSGHAPILRAPAENTPSAQATSRREHAEEAPFVRVDNIAKRFGAHESLRGVSFELREGRCTALLGPNGAGKTTLIRILTGLLSPTAGQVGFQGLRQGDDPRALIGYLPQTPAFHSWMSGREFLRYAAELCGLGRGESAVRSDELLERTGLGGAAGKRRIGGYSGGMKQRLGLAQALIHRPRLLVLDEPVSALDPVGRREVMELLRELKRETTILFSTHVLHDAEELCDDVMILQEGRIAVSGPIEDVRGRHSAPIILLEVERSDNARGRLADWAKHLAHPAIASIRLQTDGYAAVFQALNAEEARSYLLRQLLDSPLPVVKLEFGYSSLEDIFMMAVQSP